MRRLRLGLLVLALTLSAGWPAQAAPAAPASDVEALVSAANEARARHGLPPLLLSSALTSSATAYGEHLMRNEVFGHAGTLSAPGNFNRLGEALELHPGRAAYPRRTVRRWLASYSHRVLLLSRGFRYAGAAAVRARFRGRTSTIWVLRLGGR
jgi:uncharacterized protein YkwD